MALFAEDENESRMSGPLIFALDAIRRRFGFNAIRVGRTL
jgi:hypothetical protein